VAVVVLGQQGAVALGLVPELLLVALRRHVVFVFVVAIRLTLRAFGCTTKKSIKKFSYRS
jgi:hypothetical protein